MGGVVGGDVGPGTYAGEVLQRRHDISKPASGWGTPATRFHGSGALVHRGPSHHRERNGRTHHRHDPGCRHERVVGESQVTGQYRQSDTYPVPTPGNVLGGIYSRARFTFSSSTVDGTGAMGGAGTGTVCLGAAAIEDYVSSNTFAMKRVAWNCVLLGGGGLRHAARCSGWLRAVGPVAPSSCPAIRGSASQRCSRPHPSAARTRRGTRSANPRRALGGDAAVRRIVGPAWSDCVANGGAAGGAAALLAGALGFAEVAPADPFGTVAAAALNLLGFVSTDQPILLVCDDAHWVDVASLGSFLFFAGRLTEQAISVVLSTRPEAVDGELARIETLELGGLDGESARMLLSERFGERLAPEVAADLISPRRRGTPSRSSRSPARFPSAESSALTRSSFRFRSGRRQRELPVTSYRADHDTRGALVIAAGGSHDDPLVLQRAFEALQIPGWRLGAGGGRRARPGQTRTDRVSPLARWFVAHHDAKVGERRAAHQALAAANSSDDPGGRRPPRGRVGTARRDVATALEGGERPR